jgi:hypothetical protein
MAPYNKTTWVDGGEPAITADKLNNLEKQYDEALAWVKSFGLGTAAKDLASGSDLNTLNATGFYVGSNLLNAPNTFSFFIFHIESSFGKRQIAYKLSTDEIFSRIETGGTWSSWDQISTRNFVTSFGLGENAASIPNSDLNAITQTGFYIVGGSANSPMNYGTVMHTERNADATQLAISTENSFPGIYMRWKVSGAWQNWVKLQTNDETHIEANLSSLAVSNGVTKILTGFTEVQDLKLNFNPSTGQFVVTTTGVYLFNIEFSHTMPIPHTGGISLERNGTNTTYKPFANTGNSSFIERSKTFYLTAGDTIRLLRTGNASGNIDGINLTISKI